jgi:PmbA protein
VNIAPYSFGVQAGESTREELFEAVGNGVYITSAKGFHAGANAVTGDFSIESAGFVIRDGKRAEPVKSFTVAGNFFDLLKQIDRLGNEIVWGIPGGFTVYGSPHILVRNVSIAGK